jgi:hypothetical protein
VGIPTEEAALSRKRNASKIHRGLIMRIESDLTKSNKVRVESQQGVSLNRGSEPKNPNSMRVESKEANLQLYLLNNVLADGVQKLVTLLDSQLFIHHRNHAVFMGLRRPPSDLLELKSLPHYSLSHKIF